MAKRTVTRLRNDPLWFKDAVIYELHVRAFSDADGDGVGDFQGLRQKLDYLEFLGVNAIWILPFYPSPLRDDGYDIADYYSVHDRYGSLKDFQAFLREAHRRGIRVITELVINHTSDQHDWFQRARRAPRDSRERDFYVWSDTPERFADARIIFEDFEHSNWAWDPVAKAYYWHRFYAHQPDLNFDNPEVRAGVLGVLDFWMNMGVDGMRLDAIPYLYQREGTDCENLPETHRFLKDLRRHVDERHPDRVLLAEANQWPEDAAAYFGDGDECHMNFHFPLMPRLFMAIQMEDRFPVVDILDQTPVTPAGCQWALFLRNHDELTLEMVTDEERDYMYRMYALEPQARINLGIRRRLAPLLGNNRRAIELMNALLLSLPGTPVIYYGDELGMGDNIYLGDRNGVRTPMQWSPNRNAGFSMANPQSLYLPPIIDPEYHFETVNVESQRNNPNSLLWWMKRAIALRRRLRAFGRGSMEILRPDNRKVLAYVRRHREDDGSEDVVLVVNNLSRFAQHVRIDLSGFAGHDVVELFGRTTFPPVRDEPYLLFLGPHSFYWFALEPASVPVVETQRPIPSLRVTGSWRSVLRNGGHDQLRGGLIRFLRARRWFAGKDKQITEIRVRDALPVSGNGDRACLGLVDVAYTEGESETYLLPLDFATGERAERLRADAPHAAIAALTVEAKHGIGEGLLFDAAFDPEFALRLVSLIDSQRKLAGWHGILAGSRTRLFRQLARRGEVEDASLRVRVSGAEQSNTSLVIGDRMILKLYRRLHEGIHPDLELGRFLSEQQRFEHVPRVCGALEYRAGRNRTITLGFLQEFVRNEGDAWSFALDHVERYLERCASQHAGMDAPALPDAVLGAGGAAGIPAIVQEAAAPFLSPARLLGERTAAMHGALAAPSEQPDFKPERFTKLARRSLFQSLRIQITTAMGRLRGAAASLSATNQALAHRVLELEQPMLESLRGLLGVDFLSYRTRTHGDYHLGQVLYTGRDFVIIDFEGEPNRSVGERRLKRSPLRDVSGMLSSFHYAAATALRTVAGRAGARDEERASLATWARAWHRWAGAVFLDAYLEPAADAAFLAGAPREEIELLIGLHRTEKALYELGYELANRPDWVWIPLEGILEAWRGSPVRA